MQQPDESVVMDIDFQQQLSAVARDGARRAENALTVLLGRPVKVEEIDTQFVTDASAAILLSLEVTHDHAAVGRLEVAGKVEGTAFVVISQRSIDQLYETFGLSVELKDHQHDEMGRSMLREVSNIAAASYINALADGWGLELSPSTVTLDLAVDGMSRGLEEASRKQGPAIVFRCAFLDEDRRPQLSLVLLLGSAEVFSHAASG